MEESDSPDTGSQDMIYWPASQSYHPLYQSQHSLTPSGTVSTQDDPLASYDDVLDLTAEDTSEAKRRKTVDTFITDYMSPQTQTASHHNMSCDQIKQDYNKVNKQREMNRKYAKDSRERKNKLLNQLEMEKKLLQSTVEIYTKLVGVYHKKASGGKIEWNRQQIEWYPDTRSIEEGPMMINCLLPVTDSSIIEELGNGPMGKILVSSTSKSSTQISSTPPVLDASPTSTRSDLGRVITKISPSSGYPTKTVPVFHAKNAALNFPISEGMSDIEECLPTSASNNFLAKKDSLKRRLKSGTDGGHEIGGKSQTGVQILLAGTARQSTYNKSNTTPLGSVKPNSSQSGSSQTKMDANVRPQRKATNQQVITSPGVANITCNPLALGGQSFYLQQDRQPAANIDNGYKAAEGPRVNMTCQDNDDLTDLIPSIETV